MSDLRVLVLSDGRPGHYNLSEGIVAALARRAGVHVTRLELRRRPVSGHVGAAMLGAGLSPSLIFSWLYGLDPHRISSAEVVVSAGGDTLAANVAAARLLGSRNIFYGSLRAYRPAWFTLTLTSYAEDARTPHPVMTLKPSRLDPDAMPVAIATPGRPPVSAGLLVGGDSGEARFAEADWQRLLELVVQTSKVWGTRWHVSNSRRTPDGVSLRLQALADADRSPIATWVDVRNAGAGTLGALLAASEAVLVTADSSSMLSEAVWTRRPVLALSPASFSLTRQEAGYRGWMERGGQARSLALADATPQRMLDLLAEIEPLARHPLEDLADLLAARLPGLRGSAAKS